ncbi:MAG: sulfotransferase [Pseudomonadota bacterium]
MSKSLRFKQLGPIAVGGVGGSGTRLVSKILCDLGIYMGSSLNHSLDNLWFTALMKNPEWFQQFPTDRQVYRSLRLFEQAMTTGLATTVSEDDKKVIEGISDINEKRDIAVPSRAHFDELLNSKAPNHDKFIGWGWKEPNSHVFLKQMVKYFDQLKYIHVIRNGLDMAYSPNQQQLNNWGSFFGIDQRRTNRSSASKSLDYWIAANQRAIKVGEASLKDRFLLLNYDKLCTSPDIEIQKLLQFMGITAGDNLMEMLVKLVVPAKSIGRHSVFGDEQFSAQQIRKVRDLCELGPLDLNRE